jgi:hypothetical protein
VSVRHSLERIVIDFSKSWTQDPCGIVSLRAAYCSASRRCDVERGPDPAGPSSEGV